jgi:hypothetical protein
VNQETISQLAQFIKKASPYIWQAAQQQYRANVVLGIEAVAIPLLLVAPFILLGRICWRRQADTELWDDFIPSWQVLAGLLYVSAGICTLVAIGNLTGLIQLLMTPDYSTIQLVTQLVPH